MIFFFPFSLFVTFLSRKMPKDKLCRHQPLFSLEQSFFFKCVTKTTTVFLFMFWPHLSKETLSTCTKLTSYKTFCQSVFKTFFFFTPDGKNKNPISVLTICVYFILKTFWCFQNEFQLIFWKFPSKLIIKNSTFTKVIKAPISVLRWFFHYRYLLNVLLVSKLV